MIATVARGAVGFAAGLLFASLPAWVPAQARTMQQKLESACAPAAERLCATVKTDPDALKACLLSHRDAVDDACLRLVDASE